MILPFTVDDVKDALIALGVGGLTVSEVRGSEKTPTGSRITWTRSPHIRGPTRWRRRGLSMGNGSEPRRNWWRGYTRLFVILWLGWVVAVAGWFVSHVWGQRTYWLELARIHGPMAPPGDLLTWQRLANESTLSHMLSELLSTNEGWLLLAVVFVGIPGMVYGVLLGAVAVTLWVVRGFRGNR